MANSLTELERLICIRDTGRTPEGVEVDWDERMKAFDKIERRQERTAEPPVDWRVIDTIEEIGDSPRRDNRRVLHEPIIRSGSAPKLGKKRETRPALKIQTAEGPDWVKLGNDERAIKAFLTAAAEGRGEDFAVLFRPFKPGRQSEAESHRRDLVARLVAEARDRDAKLEAIGAVIGQSKQRVRDLVSAGRELSG